MIKNELELMRKYPLFGLWLLLVIVLLAMAVIDTARHEITLSRLITNFGFILTTFGTYIAVSDSYKKRLESNAERIKESNL
ncbi:hypothetical protein [Heliorestis convoluta]|uniref:Uncharacterized protein n=1 Tax=Heliorestis convoluta TaxID=356322 RepID=A0A5Q2N8T4_9FIRM|nr:hypothetical protein [Heliorestis convoluta]QGG48905.1 hypothetical protein FTV88_2816 [Heliorestis convoluta]